MLCSRDPPPIIMLCYFYMVLKYASVCINRAKPYYDYTFWYWLSACIYAGTCAITNIPFAFLCSDSWISSCFTSIFNRSVLLFYWHSKKYRWYFRENFHTFAAPDLQHYFEYSFISSFFPLVCVHLVSYYAKPFLFYYEAGFLESDFLRTVCCIAKLGSCSYYGSAT